MLEGRKNMGFKHDTYQDFRKNGEDLPLNNLLLTILNQAGVEIDRFGDSSETLDTSLV